MGFLDRLRDSLTKTKQQLVERFDDVVRRADAPERRDGPVDADTLESLEEILISADVGVAATEYVLGRVRGRMRHGESLRALVKDEILAVLESAERPPATGARPHVVLIVGVNGTGKTTTVGTLASLLRAQGRAEQALEAERRYKHMLVSSLGLARRPDLLIEDTDDLRSGDSFLLCSDGLWSYFGDDELGETLANLNPREASNELVSLARQRARGAGDNLSLAIVKLEPPQ